MFFGGSPVLDLCNTILLHNGSTYEFLETKADLKAWLQGLSEISQDDQMLPQYSRKSALAIPDKKFARFIALRGSLRDYFQAIVDQDSPARQKANTKINFFLKEISFKKQIFFSETKDVIQDHSKNTDQVLVFMVASWLQAFLVNANRDRIKRCKNPNCSHFFYDISKNNSRHWCSMRSCGNLIKARAFYQRSKNS